jgi:hypothetical protein
MKATKIEVPPPPPPKSDVKVVLEFTEKEAKMLRSIMVSFTGMGIEGNPLVQGSFFHTKKNFRKRNPRDFADEIYSELEKIVPQDKD